MKGAIYYLLLFVEAIATVIFSHVKISSIRAKAHLVFHWCLYDKSIYYCLQERRCKMDTHVQKNSSVHLFDACCQLQALKQKVSDYGNLEQRVERLEAEKLSMKRSLDMCNQEIRGLRATEREQRKKLSQVEHQLAELCKEKKKTQLLEKRVEEMQSRFQAMRNALGLSDGKGQSKKPGVKKRKVVEKVT